MDLPGATALGSVSFIHDTQAVKGESFVQRINILRSGSDQWRQAAGCDYSRHRTHSLEHLLDNTINQSGIPEVKSRLDRFDSRGADSNARAREFNSRQPGGPFEQSVSTRVQPGTDRATKKLFVLADCVESSCRAEVDNDTGRAVLVHRRHRVHDSICTKI